MIDKETSYTQRIHDIYPDLQIHSASLDDTGQNNDALIVNGEFIFRFPKYAPAVEQLKTEAAILSGIQPYVTLNIPNPIHTSLEPAVIGQMFVGYRMLPGEPFWGKRFATITDEQIIQALAVQLATFLRQLHTVPVKEAIPLALPPYNGYAQWADMYARLREKVFPHMRPDARQWATHHFETFLDDPRRFELEPVLIHGDFGPSNILYDADTQAINGIIDFGSAGWGDPASDFASLIGPFGYGESFLRRFYNIYPEIETVMERAKFYVGTFALQDALFGIENDDRETFKSGIASYV